jgi:hypothetical protein
MEGSLADDVLNLTFFPRSGLATSNGSKLDQACN